MILTISAILTQITAIFSGNISNIIANYDNDNWHIATFYRQINVGVKNNDFFKTFF